MPAPALGASATGHRLSLVLGVMTAPGATRNRDNLRALSHRPHAHGVRTVFVLGDVDCARRPTAAEHIAHRDFVFVNASDCQTWHRAAKVDAWYRHALARWPSAHWIGKSEDDALVRVSALARDLAALDATQPWYYGIMAWIGLCDSEAPACDSAPTGCCLGACFAGPLQRVHTNSSACMSGRCSPPGCRPKPPAAARRRSCPPQPCAEALVVPFAIGPVEVRSAPLARAVAECSTSGRYFASLSVAGETLREDFSSMDGNQGLPLARCVPRLRLADATWKRMSYPNSAMRNAPLMGNDTWLAWSHPLKHAPPPLARRVWSAFGQLRYRPEPLHTYTFEAGRRLAFTGALGGTS
mmetsp:Transcript_36050/g.117317  ORF Transcript_36050/g.117317 Transcript_36050/m.117317 type:complete len:354 (-) Transcript_36050:31-1092(-)